MPPPTPHVVRVEALSHALNGALRDLQEVAELDV